MNKKRLSVVMAGAMLASSVAPVLAAEVTAETMPLDQRGLVMAGIRNLMKEKMLDGTLDTEDSAYGFTVVPKGTSDKLANGTVDPDKFNNKLSDITTKLQSLSTESTIRIYEKQTTTDKYGKLTDKAQSDIEETFGDKIVADVTNLNALIGTSASSQKYEDNKFVDKVEAVDSNDMKKGVKITLNVTDNMNTGANNQVVITLLPGQDLLDLERPMDANGKLLNFENVDDVQKFDHFDVAKEKINGVDKEDELPGKTLIQEINLVGKAAAEDYFLVEDLFDGLMLTDKGMELLEILKENPDDGKKLDYSVESVSNLLPGIYGFNIKVEDNDDTKNNKTISVRGLNSKDATILQSWFTNKKFNVGKLAGQNRYETAVKIAKEQAGITDAGGMGTISDIVLVNGNALVDGLSAAPLAQALKIHESATRTAAPILLTEADKLPKETKAYLKELLSDKTVGELKTKIHLVGGEAVLSEGLKEELKDLGFEVKRYGGDNREETSLEVLKAISKEDASALKNIYVVGANGEADAMSIAPVASTPGANQGAILVAKNGGLSKIAYREIDDYNVNVKIVGGEKTISADEEAKLKEIAKENGKKVERIAGENRKATNAAIIEKFYSLADAVVVAKDGQSNKMHLIDALTAANLASNKKAPIVLATDSLSKAQINELNKKAVNANALYQVGYGVSEENVMAKIAELLGLPKAF